MNQGTRIVISLLVLLVVLTGIYWIATAPSKRQPAGAGAGPGAGTASETGGASPDAATAAALERAKSMAGTAGSGPGATSSPRPPASPSSPTKPSTPELASGVRPSAGGASSDSGSARGDALGAPPSGSSATPRGEVGGKGDSLEDNFTVVRPRGPMPALANVPVGFSPAGPRSVPAGTTPPAAPPASTPGPTATGTPTGGAPPAAAPPTRATPAPGLQALEYVVRDGDTLTIIAEEWFGDGTKWPLIQQANPEVDPARLRIDQKLRMPARNATMPAVAPSRPAAAPSKPAAAPASPAVPAVDPSTHVVRDGDTLFSIAKALLGDGMRWEELYDANKATIGADPTALKVGTKLAVPKR